MKRQSGRRKGLKIPRPEKRTGSSPVSGTRQKQELLHGFVEVFLIGE